MSEPSIRGPVRRRAVGFVVPYRQAEGRLHAAELVAVQWAEPGQDRLAVLGEQHPHRSRVLGMRGPLDQPLPLCAVDQLDHALVPQLEPIGQLPDGGPLAF